MIILRADNRTLTQGAKFSLLSTNYQAGVTSLVVLNAIGFTANDYILLGNFGAETAEIVQVSAVNTGTQTLTVGTTKFAHAESTKVTIIPYNQARFFHTTTTTFGTADPVTALIDIQADDYYTRATDSTNATGYGWYVWYNSTTATLSSNSNAIPYAGFGYTTIRHALDLFYSELNNNELKLITDREALSWMNEAYKIARAELALVNKEYGASDETDINVTAGTAEYPLPDDFGDVITVWLGSEKVPIKPIAIEKIETWAANSANRTRYYLRGANIGFTPTPTDSRTYLLRYNILPADITSYSDSIGLPDTGVYVLRDYMLFRAATKIQRISGKTNFDMFNSGVARLKITAHKQTGDIDSWEPAPSTVV